MGVAVVTASRRCGANMSVRADRSTPGLRERKKAKTKAAIQDHAPALFCRQGYAAATVEQVADAAEVSESTFFRYFPIKEDVSSPTSSARPSRAHSSHSPRSLGIIAALRFTTWSVIERCPPEELADLRDRSVMIFGAPEVWGSHSSS
jgi:hypothetical protein